MANGNGSWSSRKYKTAWSLTALTTVALVAPYIASILIETACKELITGSQWLTFLFGIWGIYFGANVAEKHGMFQAQNKGRIQRIPKPDVPEGEE